MCKLGLFPPKSSYCFLFMSFFSLSPILSYKYMSVFHSILLWNVSKLYGYHWTWKKCCIFSKHNCKWKENLLISRYCLNQTNYIYYIHNGKITKTNNRNNNNNNRWKWKLKNERRNEFENLNDVLTMKINKIYFKHWISVAFDLASVCETGLVSGWHLSNRCDITSNLW